MPCEQTVLETFDLSAVRTVCLGALASEQPKHLYARLGFRPLTLARAWVRELPIAK